MFNESEFEIDSAKDDHSNGFTIKTRLFSGNLFGKEICICNSIKLNFVSLQSEWLCPTEFVI